MIELVAPRMVEADGGSIISVTSVAAIRLGPVITAYAASNAALMAPTVGLATPYGPTVPVDSISPGMLDTGAAPGSGSRRSSRNGFGPWRRGGPRIRTRSLVRCYISRVMPRPSLRESTSPLTVVWTMARKPQLLVIAVASRVVPVVGRVGRYHEPMILSRLANSPYRS